MAIHPTAIIDPSLEIPPDLEVGPYAVIDKGVSLASGVSIGPFCHVYAGTRLESKVRLDDGVVVGNTPQDLKYRGEPSEAWVGAGTVLREYVTVNRGTAASGLTRIGTDCLIMAYSHVAHDCKIGDGVIIANGVQMGGHVRIGDKAVISGMTGIHQFTSIGAGAFIGGGLRVDKDVLPYTKALGEPLRYGGLNEMGLARAGWPIGAGAWLRSLYRGRDRERTLAGASDLAGWEKRIADGELEGLGGLARELRDFLATRRRGLLLREPMPE